MIFILLTLLFIVGFACAMKAKDWLRWTLVGMGSLPLLGIAQ